MLLTESTVKRLIKDYTPQMVLYPEIPARTPRKSVWNKNFKDTFTSPLPFDYHPRDIKIVLENSVFHEKFGGFFNFGGRRTKWSKMLDRMEKEGYEKDLDVLPRVKRDDKAKFWSRYGEINKTSPDYNKVCYAREVYDPSGKFVLIQYWYAYFYNDFWNDHEMDWETVMIVFALDEGDPRPIHCAISAHHTGFVLDWREVEKEGTHPVIYVANGSHANYFYGPGWYNTVDIFQTEEFNRLASKYAAIFKGERVELKDYTTSRGSDGETLVEAMHIPADETKWNTGYWRWLKQKGLWGSRGLLGSTLGDSGPSGPQLNQLKWDVPFDWVYKECMPPEKPNQPPR